VVTGSRQMSLGGVGVDLDQLVHHARGQLRLVLLAAENERQIPVNFDMVRRRGSFDVELIGVGIVSDQLV
jgi:hypothetical protein